MDRTPVIRRRDLLAAAGCLAVGIGSPYAGVFPTSVGLIIVGSGAAGLSAAYWAAKNGVKDVLVVEKEPIIGGSSTIAEGVFSVSDTTYQRQHDIQDRDELFFDDMMRQGNYKNDASLVRLYIRESKSFYLWLHSIGIEPHGVILSSGMSVPRAHSFNSTQLIQTMRLMSQKEGVRILTSTRAVDLVTDQKKRVTGLLIERSGGRRETIDSRYGVILATGGFTRNPVLLERFAPALKHASVVSGVGSEGEGIEMALKLGAELLDTAYIKASYGFRLNPSSISDFTSIYYEGAIIVNQEGVRFVNESASYKTLGDYALQQSEGKSYIIFDDSIRKNAMEQRAIDRMLWSPIDRGEKIDYAFYDETIEGVAKKAGLRPEIVAATVRRYNESVQQGIDPEFGRKTLSFDYGKPVPITQPPFFIMPSVPAIMGTYCGVRVNERMEVIGKGGEPIAGLYAAGEVLGGVHGENYITGTGLGKALTFGKVAGESVAKLTGK